MAISSALNPSSIVKEKSATAAGAQNFITGGSPLGTGVVASAANKIVQFQRGAAAGIAAKPPDLNSMISTLSTNILTNVQNQVSSINQNVTQFVQQKLGEIQKNYRSRIDQIDAARPNSILNNFLSLYKEAIGYIQFLGNPRNVKTLRKNLQGLQEVFKQTFRIARLIRSTIIKIVQQLSSLPQASTGPGGINLDISVPGGGLRRSAPNGLMRMMRRRPGMMLGGAALAGGLGSQVVSGMLDVGGGGVQAAPMSEGTIPTTLLDRFSGILDRFSKAIQSFARGSQTQSSSSSSSGGIQPDTPSTTDPGGPGGPSPSSGGAVSSAPGDEKLAAFVASMEAASPENAADAMQVMLNRSASGKYGNGLAGTLSGYDQFSPISAAIFGKSKDEDAAAKYGPIAATLPGNTPQEKFKYLQQVAAEPDGLNKLQQIFGGGSATVAATILNDPKYLEASRQNVKGALNFYGGRQYNPADVQFRPGGNWFWNFTGPVGKLSGQPTATPTGQVTTPPPAVAPAPNQAASNQAAAQSVAQPPTQAPTQSSPSVVPFSVGDQGAQSKPSTNKSTPPPTLTKPDAASLPFLTSSNDDNFLSLYSRLTYNIVDG